MFVGLVLGVLCTYGTLVLSGFGSPACFLIEGPSSWALGLSCFLSLPLSTGAQEFWAMGLTSFLVSWGLTMHEQTLLLAPFGAV